MTLCRLVISYRFFGEDFRLYLHGTPRSLFEDFHFFFVNIGLGQRAAIYFALGLFRRFLIHGLSLCSLLGTILVYVGPGVSYWLRRCATSRKVPGSIPGGVTWDFFPWYHRQNHVPWGRLSLWKWVPGISPGVKAGGGFGWRPTTHVVPKRQENPGP